MKTEAFEPQNRFEMSMKLVILLKRLIKDANQLKPKVFDMGDFLSPFPFAVRLILDNSFFFPVCHSVPLMPLRPSVDRPYAELLPANSEK